MCGEAPCRAPAVANVAGDFFRAVLDTGIVLEEDRPAVEHADDQAVGQMYMEQYFLHKDSKMMAPMKARLDAEIATPDDPAKPLWWWCDALFMAPPAFLALLELGWAQAIAVVLGSLLIYVVIGNVVGRRLVAHHTNLSPLVVVLSVVVWGWVLGLLGGLLAVPMTLLVRRLFIEVYDESGWTTALLGRPHRERGPAS